MVRACWAEWCTACSGVCGVPSVLPVLVIQVLNRTLGYAARAGATSEQSSLAQSTSAPCIPKTGVVHVKSVDGNNECGYLSGKPNQYDLKGQFSCTSQKEDALIVLASCDAPKFDLVALVSMLIVAG